VRAILLFCALTLPAAAATAQDTHRCREVRPGELVCDEVRVTPERPTFFLLSRTRGEHRATELRRDLVESIPRSVRRAPF